ILGAAAAHSRLEVCVESGFTRAGKKMCGIRDLETEPDVGPGLRLTAILRGDAPIDAVAAVLPEVGEAVVPGRIMKDEERKLRGHSCKRLSLRVHSGDEHPEILDRFASRLCA